MIRSSTQTIVGGAVVALLLILLAPQALASDLQADFRFENGFESSVGKAKKLDKEGSCGSSCKLGTVKVNGKNQGVWKWKAGAGLKLGKANKLLGQGGDTYTIAMLVRLNEVSDYRKLVDLHDRQDDEGWYVYDKSLYPYDLPAFDYEKQRIQADRWRQIVLTRDGQGVARGFVDGKQLGKASDPSGNVAQMGTDNLHFLIDNEGGSEQSGGAIARLRIWDKALPKQKIKQLDD